MRPHADPCSCFPTGRHYPGIAHLVRMAVRGLVDAFKPDRPWAELPIALVDVETTGRDPAADRVVEVGIAVARGGVITSRGWLVDPGLPIPADATAVHGITDEDVRYSPAFADIAGELREAVAGCVPAAYNAAFDRAFLEAECARAGVKAPFGAVEWLDPLVWARELQKEHRSRALGEVCARLGIDHQAAHRARGDAEAALRVLFALGADPRVPRAYSDLVREQRRLAGEQADRRRAWNLT